MIDRALISVFDKTAGSIQEQADKLSAMDTIAVSEGEDLDRQLAAHDGLGQQRVIDPHIGHEIGGFRPYAPEAPVSRWTGRSLPAEEVFPQATCDTAKAAASRLTGKEARERAERFLASCELITEATSFGGVHSTAERRARWAGGSRHCTPCARCLISGSPTSGCSKRW